MSKKSLLNLIPKPILKKAINELESVLEENETTSPKQKRDETSATEESLGQISVVEKKELYTMAEIVSWAQANYPNEDGIALSIIKEKSNDKDYPYLIYLIWCNGNTPLLTKKYKSMAIYCNRIDDELYETFGNNDIITLE